MSPRTYVARSRRQGEGTSRQGVRPSPPPSGVDEDRSTARLRWDGGPPESLSRQVPQEPSSARGVIQHFCPCHQRPAPAVRQDARVPSVVLESIGDSAITDADHPPQGVLPDDINATGGHVAWFDGLHAARDSAVALDPLHGHSGSGSRSVAGGSASWGGEGGLTGRRRSTSP